MSELAAVQDDEIVWSVGERIRKAREDKGWLQKDLADELHVERSTVSGWEANAHRPSFLAFRAIADLTGKKQWWLEGKDVAPIQPSGGVARLQDRRSRNRPRGQVIRPNSCFLVRAA